MAPTSPSTPLDQPPFIYHKPPRLRRIQYFLQLWTIKIIYMIGFYILRRFISPAPPHLRPTIVKSYPSRPHLEHRFFIPREESNLRTTDQNQDGLRQVTIKSDQQTHPTLYPLYISIHGGGFALCDAEFDDEFCATFSRTHHVLVANLSYSLTPSSRFPTSLNDIIAAIHAILHDETLPIDHTRICLAGFSAGANLAIAASQHVSLQGIIHAVVAWYPVTDMTLTAQEKQATRAYRSVFDRDDFANWGPVWNWAYFEEGLNVRDPRVGVKWSHREMLPEWCCVLGAEFDMLCAEAREMTEGWVGGRNGLLKRGVKGSEEDWEVDGGRTKWLLKRNVRHGFTHAITAGWAIGDHAVSRRASEDAQEEIVRWLWEGAWKEKI